MHLQNELIGELTFVILAYKESPYLPQCIESLRRQTVPVRLVISTSTGNGFIDETAKRFGIPVITHELHGIANDWNAALSCAVTNLVTLAHQADIYDPFYAEAIMDAFEKARQGGERPQILFTDYYEIRSDQRVYTNKNLQVKRRLLKPLCSTGKRRTIHARRYVLRFGNAICCPAVTYVRNNLPLPLFKEGMESNIDWQAWERISKDPGSFIYIPRPLVGHRIHAESTTSALIESRGRSNEDYEMLCKFWPAWIASLIERAYSKAEDSNQNRQRG